MEANEIQMLGAVALLDDGISLPLHTVLRRKPFRLTMKIPVTRSFIRASKAYLSIGVTPEEYEGYDFTGKMRFVAEHGKAVSRIVAAGILRGPVMGRLLSRPLAWLLRETMHPVALMEAWKLLLNETAVTSFGIIITLAAAMNKMQPLVSRNESGSGTRS
jgi:hypothetical protein